MTTIAQEKDGLLDGMPRDKRGYWQPEEGPAPPNPLFAWPPKPAAALKWLYRYFFPWHVFYMVLAVISWLYFTPDMSRMVNLRPDWIILILVRNEILLILFVSVLHLRLWTRKAQGYRYKYTPDWIGVNKRKFLWNNQLWDNVFWSCVSGGITWTVYEVLMLWAYANGWLPYVNPQEQPVYFGLLLCVIQLWRLFHFYWVHRWLHWPPLYKAAHHIHHRNINVGPWSGLSMHPIEHILYYTCMLIHIVVPSHPVHMIFNGLHASLTPAPGHSGFDQVIIRGETSHGHVNIPAGSFFHQLHHRYFECNYGETDFPLDHWFGSDYDGSPEALEAMRAKQRARHGNAE
jgi:sterol desaturase/sphingolipid hydroxylase (fatty acid hydroxylase superfamily)